MRAFSNANPKNIRDAVSMLSQAHQQGRSTSIVGGGSDLLGMVKEHLVAPDVLERRRAAWRAPAKPARGWDRIVADQVLQADEGCDLAVLRAMG